MNQGKAPYRCYICPVCPVCARDSSSSLFLQVYQSSRPSTVLSKGSKLAGSARHHVHYSAHYYHTFLLGLPKTTIISRTTFSVTLAYTTSATMQFISLLVTLFFALCVSAQDSTAVTTYYKTFTVLNVVETTTCTSALSSSAAANTTTFALTTLATHVAAVNITSAAPTTATWVASTGPSAHPAASANGTSSYTVAVKPTSSSTSTMNSGASGMTVSLGAAGAVAALLSLAQML